MNTITTTNFPNLKLFKQGKVRDVYDVGNALLLVATDRISAFDVVFSEGIPYKGTVLTQFSEFWFEQTQDIIKNHLISVKDFPEECKKYEEQLKGRTMLVKKTTPLPVECVVRGYLAGSGWQEYQQTQSICGISLPSGLQESAKLPEPIFTPATKEEQGKHDENISFEQTIKILGKELAEKVKNISLAIYKRASEIAEKKGIIIADTKMEFGIYNNELLLIDELLTPDSSRFWLKEHYIAGKKQESFDKQFVREYLLSINFNKKPPAPKLPQHIIQQTSELYQKAYFLLTGKKIAQ
mgnify:CR=1 FL=1